MNREETQSTKEDGSVVGCLSEGHLYLSFGGFVVIKEMPFGWPRLRVRSGGFSVNPRALHQVSIMMRYL